MQGLINKYVSHWSCKSLNRWLHAATGKHWPLTALMYWTNTIILLLNGCGWGCAENIIKCSQNIFANLLKIKWRWYKTHGRPKLNSFLVDKQRDKMPYCTVSNVFKSFKIVLLSPKSTFMTSLFYILQYSVCLNTPLLFPPPPHPRSFGVLPSSTPELCHASLATQKLQISSLLFYSG